jgi:hypothetical protein
VLQSDRSALRVLFMGQGITFILICIFFIDGYPGKGGGGSYVTVV